MLAQKSRGLAEIIPYRKWRYANPRLTLKGIQETVVRQVERAYPKCHQIYLSTAQRHTYMWYGRQDEKIYLAMVAIKQKLTSRLKIISEASSDGRGANEFEAWLALYDEHYCPEGDPFNDCKHELVRVKSPLNCINTDSRLGKQGFYVQQCTVCGMLFGTRYQTDEGTGSDDLTFALDHLNPQRHY